jgi:hypothetical protein
LRIADWVGKIRNSRSEIHDCISQRVVASLRPADAVQLAQVFDLYDDVSHRQSTTRNGWSGPNVGGRQSSLFEGRDQITYP